MNAPLFSNSFNIASGNPNEFVLSFRFQEGNKQSEQDLIPLFRIAMSRDGMYALTRLLSKALDDTRGKGTQETQGRL